MKNYFVMFAIVGLLTSCVTPQPATQESQTQATETPPLTSPTPASISSTFIATNTSPAATVLITDDFFTQNGITLPAPACNGFTQLQTEGPYYTPNTPERNSLLEEGMTGTGLLLIGFVLDQNCQPLANAKLDFWQADANGQYDNAGYRLRGHQFTDSQGRYYLETIFPGLYESRPIEHIHVKIQPEGGAEVTSQLYFPQQSIKGLTVTIEEREGYLVGYFNFVVQK